MGLVNMRTLLKKAEEGSWAVGSFSVANMECIEGVIAAAEACRAPIIMQIAEARLPYSPLHLIGPMMIAAAEHAHVPVAVHLDHGKRWISALPPSCVTARTARSMKTSR